MKLQHFQCDAPNLQRFFLSYYLVEGLDNDRSNFRAFPSNNSVLSLGWNTLIERINDTIVLHNSPDTCYSIFFDTITKPFSFEYQGPIYELSILIRPEYTAFFAERLAYLQRKGKKWNKAILDLQLSIFCTKDPGRRQYLIELWLRDTLLGNQQPSKDEVAVIGITMRLLDKGMSVQSIASLIGTSRKTLHKTFRAHTLRTPGSYQRIGRFRSAIQVRQEDTKESLTGLAYISGYYDQSHMVRDFRRLSGLTPRQLLAEILQLEKECDVYWQPL
ncbi:MAG: AraC-like DNA-binding protein [Neolewinella sp.]|jgi:AraC-like DNA-binding protein